MLASIKGAADKVKYDGRAKACFPPMLWCKVIVWSWESQTLWTDSFYAKRWGKYPGLIFLKDVACFHQSHRNMHCLDIYDFLLPDIPHQMKSFPLTFERLESYFTSNMSFSIQFEETQTYFNEEILLHWNLTKKKEKQQPWNFIWFPREKG